MKIRENIEIEKQGHLNKRNDLANLPGIWKAIIRKQDTCRELKNFQNSAVVCTGSCIVFKPPAYLIFSVPPISRGHLPSAITSDDMMR